MELPSLYQSYIHKSRYARYNWELKRRETWEETVDRYMGFFTDHLQKNHSYDIKADGSLYSELRNGILELKAMPSMRALMTAGEALMRENIAGFNCSFIAIDNPRAFDEILYILMNGTGVGFSAETEHTRKLPVIAEEFYETDTTIVVADSKLGWAKSLKELISLLYQGLIPKNDTSKLRKAGSPLKTFGGRSSGPEPLIALFDYAIKLFKNAAGRKLTSIECHDLVCNIANIVVVGGVRRSALISLSDLGDDRIRDAKSGEWWVRYPYRSISNNSAVYNEKPEIGTFMEEWIALYKSKSGERGIFNRESAVKQAMKSGRRDLTGYIVGTNPCGEIILRSLEFCNLSEVVCRADDTEETLLEKVRLATILGTFQSTLTNFKYIRKEWQRNCEEERLLGVSLTGSMDCEMLNEVNINTKMLLQRMKELAVKTNAEMADKLDINHAAAITCNKPSGTVSQLVDSASGLHTRHSAYYIRNTRLDSKDPLGKAMIDAGFEAEVDFYSNSNLVFGFPIKSPDGSLYRDSLTAISQLENWKMYHDNWCEHNPSITISVKENEWLKVGSWVYDNFDSMSGVSFLPSDDHTYQQAPYQECTKEEYEEAVSKLPANIDWNLIKEEEDDTSGAQELACVAGACDITDILEVRKDAA